MLGAGLCNPWDLLRKAGKLRGCRLRRVAKSTLSWGQRGAQGGTRASRGSEKGKWMLCGWGRRARSVFEGGKG